MWPKNLYDPKSKTQLSTQQLIIKNSDVHKYQYSIDHIQTTDINGKFHSQIEVRFNDQTKTSHDQTHRDHYQTLAYFLRGFQNFDGFDRISKILLVSSLMHITPNKEIRYNKLKVSQTE